MNSHLPSFPTPAVHPHHPRAQAVPSPAMPSFTQQTKFPCGFYTIASPAGVHMNPSLVRWGGHLWLTVRSLHINRNTIWIYKLLNNVVQVPGVQIKIPLLYLSEQQEDPRIFCGTDGRPIISWCQYIPQRTPPHQAYGVLTDAMEVTNVTHVPHGNNGNCISTNKGPEKNWVFFEHDTKLHFVWGTIPTEICEVSGHKVSQVYKTSPKGIVWPWGQPRGGTPPVLIGDEYFSFFHSSSAYRHTSRYYMGCYAFEAKPPFRMTKISIKPILAGSEADPHQTSPPFVVFPGGSIYEAGQWLVVLGINDSKCGWIKIPHADLLGTLTKVEHV